MPPRFAWLKLNCSHRAPERRALGEMREIGGAQDPTGLLYQTRWRRLCSAKPTVIQNTLGSTAMCCAYHPRQRPEVDKPGMPTVLVCEGRPGPEWQSMAGGVARFSVLCAIPPPKAKPIDSGGLYLYHYCCSRGTLKATEDCSGT